MYPRRSVYKILFYYWFLIAYGSIGTLLTDWSIKRNCILCSTIPVMNQIKIVLSMSTLKDIKMSEKSVRYYLCICMKSKFNPLFIYFFMSILLFRFISPKGRNMPNMTQWPIFSIIWTIRYHVNINYFVRIKINIYVSIKWFGSTT